MNFLYDINILRDKEVYIYGAGEVGVSLYEKIQNNITTKKIIFIDDYFEGQIYNNQVFRYEDIKIPTDAILVICNRFLELFQNKINENFLVYFLDVPDDGYKLQKKDFNKKIEYVCNNLDEDSSNLYRILLDIRDANKNCRFSSLHKILLRKKLGVQYLSHTPNPKSTIGVIIDAGYYDGHTSLSYSKFFANYHRIDAFDPSPVRVIKIPKFNLIKKCISDKVGPIKFYNNTKTPTSSKISTVDGPGVIEVESVTLDTHYSEGLPPNSIIKMDLEGGETKSLLGGLRLLKNYRPWLAVSIYHSYNDMIEIPTLLINYLPNYKWKIGHYSYGYNETVLYGIPC